MNGRSILITGGTGSFGKAFVAETLRRFPDVQRLVVFSRDELKQYEMAKSYPEADFPAVRFFIGDVRDRDRLKRALYKVDTVVHAAALKHVPTAEYNPMEFIRTNIMGAANLIEASIDAGVKRLVALSTDKAAAPINLYGATKLCADKLFVAANNYTGAGGPAFSVVRYGNVMGSRGSVIPHFLELASSSDNGAPVLPVTDAGMTRFSITLPEAVDMVLWAIEEAKGGEILVPKIPSYRLDDLVEAIAPGCERKIVGIRAGEKIHEEMITASDSLTTVDLGQYYAILPNRGRASFSRYPEHRRAVPVEPGFAYSSGTNSDFLTVEQLRTLIREEIDKDFQPLPPPPGRTVIPYGRQFISGDDVQAVVNVLRSDWLTQGPVVPSFEASICRAVGAAHAVVANSGTSALHIACLALGLGPGGLLWTVPNTFVASANCGLYCGADVDFVDIDPDSLCMSVDALEAKLRRSARAPDVVVPVDFAGQPCEIGAFRSLADEFGFRLLEDASHAIGATHEGAPVGGAGKADVVVFGFHPVKIVTSAEGGVAVTESSDLASAMRRLRSHGITRNLEEMDGAPDGSWSYQQIELGMNYRMTDLLAALGLSQLKRLRDFVARRTALAARYDYLLKDFSGVVRPRLAPNRTSSWHLYVIQVPKAKRQVIFEGLREVGIGANVHYIPVHLQPYYRRRFGFKTGDFPVSEAYYDGAITLPLHPALTEEDQDRVVDTLQELL